MKTFLAALALAGSVFTIAGQASTIVNVSALSSTGTSLTLAAGTYDISIIGVSQGGLYNAWDDATMNFGANNATPAPNGWKDSFTINANGVTTSYIAPGDPTSTSALGALATYQASVLDPSSKTTNTVLLTLFSRQSVNFTVSDYLFVDNWGGESFSVTPTLACATPEPSTFGMIGLAFAGVISVIRKKLAN